MYCFCMENMCTGNRVNTNYELITSCTGSQFQTRAPESQGNSAAHYYGKCPNHSVKTHPQPTHIDIYVYTCGVYVYVYIDIYIYIWSVFLSHNPFYSTYFVPFHRRHFDSFYIYIYVYSSDRNRESVPRYSWENRLFSTCWNMQIWGYMYHWNDIIVYCNRYHKVAPL